MRAKRIAAKDLARARYRCAQGRATARFSTSRKLAKRLTKKRTTAATAIVSQAGKASRLYFDLTAGRAKTPTPGFWTDGHLDCTQGYLVEPDFTAKSPIPISTRGWVAYYTRRDGLALARQRGRRHRSLEPVDGDGLRRRAVPSERRHRPGAVDPGPDRRPGRPRPLHGRRLRDRLLGRRAGRVQLAVRQRGTDRRRRRRFCQLVLRVPVNALVTGGAGFIGSHLVDALLDRGDRVTALDDLSTGHWENLAGALTRGAGVRRVSVMDAAAVDRAFAEIAAGRGLPPRRADRRPPRGRRSRSRRDDQHPRHRERARRRAAPQRRPRRAGLDRRRDLWRRGRAADAGDRPPRPASPYAASKAAAESYMELYWQLHGLSTFTLRLANVYGPRQAGGEAGVIAIFCAAAAARAPVTIYGDGGQTRDFVYVADVVDAFLLAGDRDGRRPLQHRHRPRDDACSSSRASSACGPASSPSVPARSAARAWTRALAAQTLGWLPATTLQDGLQRTLTSTAPAARRARGA